MAATVEFDEETIYGPRGSALDPQGHVNAGGGLIGVDGNPVEVFAFTGVGQLPVGGAAEVTYQT